MQKIINHDFSSGVSATRLVNWHSYKMIELFSRRRFCYTWIYRIEHFNTIHSRLKIIFDEHGTADSSWQTCDKLELISTEVRITMTTKCRRPFSFFFIHKYLYWTFTNAKELMIQICHMVEYFIMVNVAQLTRKNKQAHFDKYQIIHFQLTPLQKVDN